MSVEATAIVVSVVLAFVGYVVKYANDLRLAQRKHRLERVSRQLSDLYGPLFALSAASGRLWSEFTRLHSTPGESAFWSRRGPPTTEQTDAWRLWMTTVFMPLNVEMRNAVVDHADLLREPNELPRCLLDLCAHVAGYEIVLARWQSGNFNPTDFRDNTSVINFPADELARYAAAAYLDLKREQSMLLRWGRVSATPPPPEESPSAA
jgi:hypothetical protein